MPKMGNKTKDLVEIVDIQTAIIHLQSDAIDELFRLLSQHLTMDELDNLPVVEKINLAAELRHTELNKVLEP